MIVALLLASRKGRRRARRRHAPDPRTKLLGAWQEHLDMLTESGLPELTTMTSKEIAELTLEQFGTGAGERTAVLGRAANSVAYSARTIVDSNEVSEAWANQRALRRIVRKQLRRPHGSPRPVRYYRPQRYGRCRTRRRGQPSPPRGQAPRTGVAAPPVTPLPGPPTPVGLALRSRGGLRGRAGP